MAGFLHTCSLYHARKEYVLTVSPPSVRYLKYAIYEYFCCKEEELYEKMLYLWKR